MQSCAKVMLCIVCINKKQEKGDKYGFRTT